MKSVITTFLIVTSITVFGQQNVNKLIGKWKYQDVYQKEKIDSTGIKMIEMFFGNMTIQFNNDGLYKASIMGKDEQGKWISENNKTITFTSDKGNITKIDLIKLNEDKLIFKMQKSSFVMTKMQESEIDKIIETEITFKTVKATNEQISKKWYLKSKESSKTGSDELKEVANELLKGSYMDLSKTGKYEVQILKIKEKGKWEFGEDNESIVTIKDGNKKVWNIISISEREMILIPGLTNEKWIFGSSE